MGEMTKGPLRKLRIVLEMIKAEHTVFALPFAYVGAWLASGGVPSFFHFVWITVAMVGARSTAMALNRLIDRHIDARNPRTSDRALPMGLVNATFVGAFTGASVVVFLFAAYMLGPVCLYLSPLAVGVLTGYSYTKRFTWLCHAWLGMALSIAPAGAWIAVRGSLGPVPILLAMGVTLWTAGFDIIYACLDEDFDRAAGLYSIPARVGVGRALSVSKWLYGAAVAAFAGAGALAGMGPAYYVGVAVAASLLVRQHILVSPTDLSKVNLAFATMNGALSLIFLMATILDYWVRSWS